MEKTGLVDFNAGKTQLISFDQFNDVTIDVNMDRSVLVEKLSFKMLGWASLVNWIGAP